MTLRTLGGRGVDEYTREFFITWGIGKRVRGNGVLILVAVQDRAVGIDGAGLLQGLSHGRDRASIRESFLPALGTNETYGHSLLAGANQMMDWVRWKEKVATWRSIVLDILVSLAAFALGIATGAQVGPAILGAYATLYLGTLGDGPSGVAFNLLAMGLFVWGFVLGRRSSWRRRLRGPGNDADGWIEGNARLAYVVRLVTFRPVAKKDEGRRPRIVCELSARLLFLCWRPRTPARFVRRSSSRLVIWDGCAKGSRPPMNQRWRHASSARGGRGTGAPSRFPGIVQQSGPVLALCFGPRRGAHHAVVAEEVPLRILVVVDPVAEPGDHRGCFDPRLHPVDCA